MHLRDTHGGTSINYAGGGGQGNHMAQMYALAFRKACQTPYIYSSLAQEKTGNFWVHGKLFGKQNINYGEPVAAQFDISEGDSVELSSETGTIKIVATIVDEVPVGVLSMPNGHGMNFVKKSSHKEVGAMPNILTSSTYCDPIAKTPYHKNVRVKLKKLQEAELV